MSGSFTDRQATSKRVTPTSHQARQPGSGLVLRLVDRVPVTRRPGPDTV